MEDEQTVLNSKTLVPIGVITVFIGGAMWLSAMFWNIQQNKQTIASLETRVAALQSEQVNVTDRMARIETKLDILIDAIQQ